MREWLWVIGGIYVLLGVRFTPVVNAKQFTSVLTGWTAPSSSTEFKVVVDWEWVFGLDLFAIGLVALVAGSVATTATLVVLVWLICSRELFGGIVPDAWFLRRGVYNRPVYAGFIVFHLIVIGTGLLLIRAG